MVKRGDPVDLRLLHFFRVARGFKDMSHNNQFEKKDKAIRLAKAAQAAVQTKKDGSDAAINPSGPHPLP